MGYKGTVKGKVIELDELLPCPDGTRVEVTVQPEAQPEKKPRKNSPQVLLQLAGTLTEEEAEAIMKVVREHVRKIDWEMWRQDERWDTCLTPITPVTCKGDILPLFSI